MAKKKKHITIKASVISLKNFDDYESSLDLDDRKKTVELLLEMFKAGDHDAVLELAELYIDHLRKRKMSKLAKIPLRKETDKKKMTLSIWMEFCKLLKENEILWLTVYFQEEARAAGINNIKVSISKAI